MLIRLGQGLAPAASNSNYSAPVIDNTPKVIALIGDSITSQNNSSNEKECLSQGYMTWINALTGQRYYYQPAANLGVNGDTMAEILARITDLAAFSPDIVFLCSSFANDIAGSTTEQDLKGDFDAIASYVKNTLGAVLVAGTPLPRTQSGGAPLTSTQQTLLNNLKSHVLSKTISDGVIPVNIYDNMVATGTDNPDTDKFDNEGGTLLHPKPAGAYQMALDIMSVLNPIYGTYDIPDMSACDLGINSNFSGTSGSESGPINSAIVADDWLLYAYSGASGTANKNAEGQQVIDISYTDSRSYDVWRLIGDDITTGFSTGDAFYIEAEVEILNADNVRTITGLDIVFDNSGAYKAMSPYDINSTPNGFTGTLHLRTPIITISASDTSIEPRIWSQMNSVGMTSNSNIVLKQIRFVKNKPLSH